MGERQERKWGEAKRKGRDKKEDIYIYREREREEERWGEARRKMEGDKKNGGKQEA